MLANKHAKSYVCIDLKSFYASVECVDRGLDPFTENLVVADPDRGSGTILPCHNTRHESTGRKKPLPHFPDPQRHRIHHGNAAHGSLHGGIGADKRLVPALRKHRGHPRIQASTNASSMQLPT